MDKNRMILGLVTMNVGTGLILLATHMENRMLKKSNYSCRKSVAALVSVQQEMNHLIPYAPSSEAKRIKEACEFWSATMDI